MWLWGGLHFILKPSTQRPMDAGDKKRPGGIRQRLESEHLERTRASSLANYLLGQYAWGTMSVQQVQDIASLAMEDLQQTESLVRFPDFEQLSKLGSSGMHVNNMSRDIGRYIDSIGNLPPTSAVEIPTKQGDAKTGIMLPHEIFSFLFENYPTAFKKLFMPGGENDCENFWRQCSGASTLHGQPALRRLDTKKAVPIGFHGDEVPIGGRGKTWCKLAVVLSFFSLLATSMPTKDSLLWIWACNPAQFVSGDGGSVHAFMLVLKWSLDTLFSGVWPRTDHRGVRYHPQSREGKKAGKHLAGGYYGIVMALIGDLDYMNKFLGLPHWTSAANPCNLCKCTKAGPLTWKDSRSNAPWRATTYTTGSWRANPDRSKNPIFDTANMSGLSCQSDYMHVKYLGYQQFFLGSVLWLLVHEILLGEPLANIRAIGLYVFRYQRRYNIPSKFPLTAWRKLSIFERQKGFPKLRGKGAHIRHVAKALSSLWNRKMSPANRNHRRIALIFKLDSEVDAILDRYSADLGYYALPAEDATSVISKQIQISQLYQVLEEQYATAATPLFNVVSKLHYSHHIFDEARHLHPHLSWCWRGEDFMNVASTLLSSCMRGRSDAGATIKAVQKYRLAMHLSWRKMNSFR